MDDPEVIREQAALRENTRGSLAQVLTRAYSSDFPRRDPVRCFLYQQISGLDFHVPSNLLPALMAVKHPVKTVVERQVPTMLLVGEEDVLAPPKLMELMARRIPHSRFVKVPGAGHSVYFERPEEFNRILLGFLKETTTRP